MQAVDGKILSGVAVPTNDEIDIVAVNTGRLHGALRRDQAHRRRRLAVAGNVSAANAGALANPLVGGIHGLFEIVIGDDLLR